MTMKLIKITDNRNLLQRHFGDEEIVDLVIGKEFEAYKHLNDDERSRRGAMNVDIHRGDVRSPGILYDTNQTVWFSSHLFEIIQQVDKGEPCHGSEMPSDEEICPIKLNGNPDKWTDNERVFAALNLIYILDQMGKADPETRDKTNEELVENGLSPEIIQMGKMVKEQIKEARDIALIAVKKEQDAENLRLRNS